MPSQNFTYSPTIRMEHMISKFQCVPFFYPDVPASFYSDHHILGQNESIFCNIDQLVKVRIKMMMVMMVMMMMMMMSRCPAILTSSAQWASTVTRDS